MSFDPNNTPGAVPPSPQPQPQQTGLAARWNSLGKSAKIGVGCLAVIVACALCGGIVSAINGGSGTTTINTAQTGGTPASSTHATQPPAATNTPKPQPKDVTVLDISGSGIKDTDTFTTSGSSQNISWTCDPSSFDNIQYNIQAFLYDADSNSADLNEPLPLNDLCKPGNTSGSSTLHLNPGKYYIKMNSEGAWTLKLVDHQNG